MSRPVSWLLTKPGLKVCCEMSDVEYEALPQTTLAQLVHDGVVVTRCVKVPFGEFVEIGGLSAALGRVGK